MGNLHHAKNGKTPARPSKTGPKGREGPDSPPDHLRGGRAVSDGRGWCLGTGKPAKRAKKGGYRMAEKCPLGANPTPGYGRRQRRDVVREGGGVRGKSESGKAGRDRTRYLRRDVLRLHPCPSRKGPAPWCRGQTGKAHPPPERIRRRAAECPIQASGPPTPWASTHSLGGHPPPGRPPWPCSPPWKAHPPPGRSLPTLSLTLSTLCLNLTRLQDAPLRRCRLHAVPQPNPTPRCAAAPVSFAPCAST